MAKFCPMCGSNVPENINNCPMCGGLINPNQQSMMNNGPMYNQPMINNQTMSNGMMNQPMNNGSMYNQPMMNNQYYNGQVMNSNNREKFTIASLILGIISLLGSIPFLIFVYLLAIPGLVFGIVGKGNKKIKYIGIILNALALIVSSILLVTSFETISEENDISGFYRCKNFNSGNVSENYTIELDLNSDNTFVYGPYGELENNYVKGTYTYEDENKTNGSGEYKYYMLTFSGKKEDFIINGVPNDTDFNSKMEFGITEKNGKREGIIMFVHNYNMYYCYEA